MQFDINEVIDASEKFAALASQYSHASIYKAQTVKQKLKQHLDQYGIPYQSKQCHVGISAFIMPEAMQDYILSAANILHGMIEKVLTALSQKDKNLVSHFEAYKTYFSFLKKQKRLWQSYGRYDFLLSTAGEVKFCGINVSGGVGYWYVPQYSKIMYETFQHDNFASCQLPQFFKYYDEYSFAKSLLRMRAETKFKKGIIAIVYDDYNLLENHFISNFDLRLLERSLKKLGEKVILTHVKNLQYKHGGFYYKHDRVCVTFNKIWLHGHHAAHDLAHTNFLQAIASNAFLPINNIASLVFAENKSLFAVFSDPKFHYLFSKTELHFIEKHIPWTRRLTNDTIMMDDKKVNLLDYVLGHQDRFVIKPNYTQQEENVFVGCDCTAAQWREAVKNLVAIGGIVQEKTNVIQLPVALVNTGNSVDITPMYHAGSLYYLNGEFAGLLSKVSTQMMMHIEQSSIIQPVLINKIG